MMHKAAQEQKVDQLEALARDRMDERSRWMQSIIQDELQRPLHVDGAEKFPAPRDVEESVRRDMLRIEAHEASVANLERSLQAKEALRLSKLRTQQQQHQQHQQQGKEQDKARSPGSGLGPSAPGAGATDPKRKEHLGKLAALRRDLSQHRHDKEREVMQLIRIQRDAPLTPAVRHSVDKHPQQQRSK